MCQCVITCLCTLDTLPASVHPATVNDASVGACLLGKTRPPESLIEATDKLHLFNISNEYRSYAYTLSPKGVGLMAHKSRDRQYQTLKRLHTEVLSQFECSYIITIEIYPGSDNDLHCHGLIRFRNHTKKEQFKKMLKEKITLNSKGTFKNLIDCEFVNSFDQWSQYIIKSQEGIIPLGYFPFIKIDYSFHNSNINTSAICIPVINKTFKINKEFDNIDDDELKRKLKQKKKLERSLAIAQNRINNLLNQISSL